MNLKEGCEEWIWKLDSLVIPQPDPVWILLFSLLSPVSYKQQGEDLQPGIAYYTLVDIVNIIG